MTHKFGVVKEGVEILAVAQDLVASSSRESACGTHFDLTSPDLYVRLDEQVNLLDVLRRSE